MLIVYKENDNEVEMYKEKSESHIKEGQVYVDSVQRK